MVDQGASSRAHRDRSSRARLGKMWPRIVAKGSRRERQAAATPTAREARTGPAAAPSAEPKVQAPRCAQAAPTQPRPAKARARSAQDQRTQRPRLARASRGAKHGRRGAADRPRASNPHAGPLSAARTAATTHGSLAHQQRPWSKVHVDGG